MHYTAVLIIERVEEAKAAEYDQYDQLKRKATERSSSEIAKVVVRAADAETLREKIKSHVDLIDED